MATELPEAKGSYVLISFVGQMKRLQIGRLGAFNIVPGYYAYVGSAFGAGGLRARLGHHLECPAEAHWHIDYLLQLAQPVEIWYTTANQKLEYHWAELLEKSPSFRVPIARFGSSDYHRSRSSHLYFSKRKPSFRNFEQQLTEQFEGVRAERYVLETTASCKRHDRPDFKLSGPLPHGRRGRADAQAGRIGSLLVVFPVTGE
jgi:Uri superfamily endonuclease